MKLFQSKTSTNGTRRIQRPMYRYVVLPSLLVVLTILATMLLRQIPSVQHLLLLPDTKNPKSGTASWLVSGDWLLYFVLGALVTGLSTYLLIDYRKHHAPLRQADPTVRYGFGHHLRVVSLPLLRYKWKPLSYVVTLGCLVVVALSVTLGVAMPKSYAYAPNEFVTTWKTDNPGASGSNQITIGTNAEFGDIYNYDVDWGDASTSTGLTDDATHTYAAAGTYTVKITGTFPHIFVAHSGDQQKLLTVEQWGTNPWTSMNSAFYLASNLTIPALDAPNLSGVTETRLMFYGATSFNSDISGWDVSNVTDMQQMFGHADAFNQPLSSWNVSNVTNMYGMFQHASSFNQPLAWDVSAVTDMEQMFWEASAFNGDITTWVPSSVISMRQMFTDATSFNQPINSWNVSSVTNMNSMFASTTTNIFNQPLNSWNVSNVTDMAGMFANDPAFNQSLASWNVSNVTDMTVMFFGGGLSTNKYDATLIGWSALTLQNGVTFDAGSSKYCNATAQRTNILTNFTWTINDTGHDCSYAPNEFVTTWKTDNPGASTDHQITIPTNGGGYNYDVDWGDGNTTVGATSDVTHTYAAIGTYTVKITGTFPAFYLSNSGDAQKILTVEQWGNNHWTSMHNAFFQATNLTVPASDAPDLSGVTDMSGMFYQNTSLNSDFSSWDVSNVTNMSHLFVEDTAFNQPLDSWNVSNVTNMSSMFGGASTFNQPLNSWNVSSVTDMGGMFSGATAFNQPLDSWNVSNVTNMLTLFFADTSFNQPLNSWNVSNVTMMSGMFAGATSFNQPLNSWNVSSVMDMSSMFTSASAFNQPLNSWNVSSVMDMGTMFNAATSFDQSLGSWDVSNVTNMTSMFGSNGLSTSNYDDTLIGWNNLTLQIPVTFDAGTSRYCLAEAQRANIISSFTWTINDSGKHCPGAFITTWKTDNPGTSTDHQITIPTNGGGYNYDVDWGDGNTSVGLTGNATHTYAAIGTYTVSITGSFPRIYVNGEFDRRKLLTVEQWGTTQWTSMAYAFTGAQNLVINATDNPDLTQVTSMVSMFANNIYDAGTSTYNINSEASVFNSDISNWDVSNVTNMSWMFQADGLYNQPLDSWNVGNVTTMQTMFNGATSFNQPLSSWDISSVISTSGMFSNATSFNQPLNSWGSEVGNVTNMAGMFADATSFNQALGSWDVSNVTDMSLLFMGATSFNQPLNSWQTGNTTHMSTMFMGATSFNQPLNSWDVSNVTDMVGMFRAATAFNQSLASWDVSKVDTASALDYEMNYWAMAQPTFFGSSSPRGMIQMFKDGSGLSVANYDATLIAWNNRSLKNGVTFDAGTSKYCYAGVQRAHIISAFAWTINDSGLSSPGCIDTPVTPETPTTPKTPAKPKTPTTSAPSTVTQTSEQTPVQQLGNPAKPDKVAFVKGKNKELPRIASIAPFFFLSLLLLIALLYSLKAWQEYRRAQAIKILLARYQTTVANVQAYVKIISHYLNTPIAVMQGSIELFMSKNMLPSAVTVPIQAKLKELSMFAATLERDAGVDLDQVNSQEHHQAVVVGAGSGHDVKTPLAVIKSKNVWAPLLAVAISVAAIDVSLMTLGGYRSASIRFANHAAFFGLGLVLLVVMAYLHQQAKSVHEAQNYLLVQQQGLLDQKQNMLGSNARVLGNFQSVLTKESDEFRPLPQTRLFFNGLAMLAKLTQSLSFAQNLATIHQNPPVHELRRIYDQVLATLKPQADAKHLTVQSTISPGLFVHADAEHAQYLVQSLVENAIHFSPENSTIQIKASQKGGKTAFVVTDHGPGIPPQQLESLFQPFSRDMKGETYNQEGLGLGLYNARLLVEQLGGKLKLTNNSPSGITAIVTLPRPTKATGMAGPEVRPASWGG